MVVLIEDLSNRRIFFFYLGNRCYNAIYKIKNKSNMFKRKIFIYSFILLILIAIFNYIGVKFCWYWTYRWYDIPMHIAGGLWVSLFFLFLYDYFVNKFTIKNYKIKVFWVVFCVLLFITVSWEIFEVLGGINFTGDRGYWPDTLGDILNGFIGGMIGYLFFIKSKKCNSQIECNSVKDDKVQL